MEPHQLSAAEAARQIREGNLTGEALMRSCLERIDARDPVVKAWLAIDRERAVQAAREQDKRRRDGAHGLLSGLPFGAKDMIDTADLPTTHNSPAFQRNQPVHDAACVAHARHAGAVLLGKTDTVEFAAFGRVAATTHPLNAAHTPGGSSAGSAAAVADLQVPFAFGTQTGGSLIRPASFNGVYALKPTWSRVSAEGVKLLAVSLDTVGWYGRSVADLALVAQVFRLLPPGADAAPQDEAPLRGLRVGICRSPQWPSIEPAGARALEAAAQRLRDAGVTIADVTLPAAFNDMSAAHLTVIETEGAAAFLDLLESSRDSMHPAMLERLSPDRLDKPEVLRHAYRVAERCRAELDRVFGDYDVLVTPAARGEAPHGHASTGEAVFNAMWSLLHVPCLAVPCTTGPNGLPVGIQLIGAEHEDAKLLRVAARIAPIIDIEGASRGRGAVINAE
jgi:Asp-tRNA(Asn)/Glu-tRNA(Gln) amidotransferase A subunit family amidase